MAAVIFKPAGPSPTGRPTYRARIDKTGASLPKKPQLSAATQATPKPGKRNVVPTGTDRKTW